VRTALEPQDIEDATYQLRFVELDVGAVRFTDRTYTDSASSTTVRLLRTEEGDLDGDGNGDGIAILVMNFGGTGSFVSLVPVLNRDGAAVPGKGAGLGDRTRIESVTIDSGTVTIGMIAHSPADPMCCPTDTVTQRFRLVGDSLTLQP
jgi:hypothetical protein